ncbi:hypothetical protein KFK09_015280 [Dendrobium nobile]|uniref:Aluminum-activated malate transporter n=1 Tax=Dendrobium nobile TaxID=94219 RepID=A0A8T3B5F5_DENNO|nr:hypothetical protein KFK09_015280 [Dendrobium nobile]
MDSITETRTKPHDCRDSVVIPVDDTEILIIEKKRKGWRCLHYVAQVIQVADYKRLVHAMKFGLALVLVSLLYMLEAVHDKLGDNAMWAVMTVVVVFEYTAGATVTKGLNRLVGTILGGGLGSLVAIIAQEIGGVGKAVIIGISIFIFGAAATYLRTIANIKKKYDYGVLIFILTLSLVSISGVRVDEIIQVASARLSSICMGFGICALVSLFIFPVWAGDELHSSLASKFNSIAHSIEDCMNSKKMMGEARKPSNCLSVLSSKSMDESLANFAKWEPWHGRFGFYYPWNKYLQIAGHLRELAACITSAEGQLKAKQEISINPLLLSIKEQCEATSLLLVNTMTQLRDCIIYMKQFPRQELVLEELQARRVQLSSHIQVSSLALTINQSAGSENGMKGSGVRIVIQVFLLVEILDKVELLVKEVKELGISAGFVNQTLDDKC